MTNTPEIDLADVRRRFARGENITQYLRGLLDRAANDAEIIEIAYDMQAGSYIEMVSKNPDFIRDYAKQLSENAQPHVRAEDRILDLGAGELTTLCGVVDAFDVRPAEVWATDISWSRLHMGRQYMAAKYPHLSGSLQLFVADFARLPLADNAVDVSLSAHALEPNGANLEPLLAEIFRITARTCVFFEPGYEFATPEGQARMEAHGYIRNMGETVEKLGGRLVSATPMQTYSNPLNPTACYVVEVPGARSARAADAPDFTVPGTNDALRNEASFLRSADHGLCFPVLDGIPLLRRNSAVLASAMDRVLDC